MNQSKSASMLDARILVPAIGDAFRKLNPKSLAKNPVMFVVAVVLHGHASHSMVTLVVDGRHAKRQEHVSSRSSTLATAPASTRGT